MFRNVLFWGLTIMLVAVIAVLATRARREEKKQAVTVAEVVRESKPTATRSISPQDLIITEARMELERSDAKPLARRQTRAVAHHQLALRNSGSVEYSSVLIGFTYLDRGDKAIESKTYVVTKPIPPGQTVSLGEISIEDVPAAAARCTARILYADFN